MDSPRRNITLFLLVLFCVMWWGVSPAASHAQSLPDYAEPLEQSPYGDDRSVEYDVWGESAFTSPFETSETTTLDEEASWDATMPAVPDSVPLPGLVWLLLAGTGLGAYSLRRSA